MSEARGQARRSILLTGLSYPLLAVGLALLFTEVTVPGAVLLGSGVFLIGINELCFYIARSGENCSDHLGGGEHENGPTTSAR